MSDWQPIETAPRDAVILLYGVGEYVGEELRMPPEPQISSGYWDSLDEAFCMSGATWKGPFVNATHWHPLPDVPPL